jgi:hypothetical protein
MGSTRLPRFRRSGSIAAIRLTPRDEEILICVQRHRFLRSDHIRALSPGSSQQITRRLQRLFHHGFLDRPRCQIEYFQSGSRRIAYGIGKKGLDWLKCERPFLLPQPASKRHKIIGRLFLEHALLVADIMVAVEMACRRRGDVRLLRTSESEQFVPSQWSVNVSHRLLFRVVPDSIFCLEYRGARCWYFLEADRGTMPVTRRRLERSSLQRKFACYVATWEQEISRSFGIRRFRVLTVTTTSTRFETIIEACKKLKCGRGLFLFADVNKLLGEADVLASAWRTCGQRTPCNLLN